MWWIPLIIVLAIVAIVTVLVLLATYANNKGDYGDGGGTYIRGTDETPFFAPANERAGAIGEKQVNYYLRPLLRSDEYLLANVILKTKNGRKAEVDAIIISRKGIFCIETKKWVGHIYGSDEDEEWVQRYDDPYRPDRHHKNPVQQCLNHCSILDKLLYERYDIEGAVIFADLEDGHGICSAYTYTIQEFRNHYRELPDDEINPDEIKQLYQKLKPYVATPLELEQYKKETRNRYN